MVFSPVGKLAMPAGFVPSFMAPASLFNMSGKEKRMGL
jgi:hypothetical protein